jgi:hypothetical protein
VKRYSFITKLLCLVFLPFALFGGPLTLLCVGEDGHLAIEIGIGGSCEEGSPCSDSHEHEHESTTETHFDSDCSSHEACCGDCVDFELELEDANVSTSSVVDDLLWAKQALPHTPIGYFFRPFPIVVLPDNRGPPTSFNASLESFSTIRLLI